MNDIVVKLRQIEEALRWRKEYSRGYGDRRDKACLRLWSDDAGNVLYMEKVLFDFNGRADFEKKADELIEANRYKTNLERVDWSKS